MTPLFWSHSRRSCTVGFPLNYAKHIHCCYLQHLENIISIKIQLGNYFPAMETAARNSSQENEIIIMLWKITQNSDVRLSFDKDHLTPSKLNIN